MTFWARPLPSLLRLLWLGPFPSSGVLPRVGLEQVLRHAKYLRVHLHCALLQVDQVEVVPLLSSLDLRALPGDAVDEVPDPLALRGHLLNELEDLPLPHRQDSDEVQQLDGVDQVAGSCPGQKEEDGLGVAVSLDLPSVP